MKRVGNLWNKITDIENIKLAHKRAREDKTYYREVKMVDSNPDFYLGEIQRLLQTKQYQVSDYIIQVINDKGKERTLMKLQYFPDRIIQWAIMLQLEPVFLNTFCTHTCASIPGRGPKRVHDLMQSFFKDGLGTQYCLQIDIRKFYDSVDHSILKSLLRKKIKDNNLLWLLDLIIDSYPGEAGVPIGSYLSQYLANYYLCYFDHFLKEDLGIKYVVRYMDDVVILYHSKRTLATWFMDIQQYLNELKLTVKHNYQVYCVSIRGIAYIGYRYFRSHILLSRKTCRRFKVLCGLVHEKQERHEMISRKQWCGMNSYVGYLEDCNSHGLVLKYIVPVLDSILRYYWYNIAMKKPLGNKIRSFNKYKAKLFKNLGLRSNYAIAGCH